MIRSLQAGRAIAAICVAAFHLSIVMGESRYGGQAAFREYTRSGARGVDFFFVLSGFIILFAHLKDIDHPRAWRKYAYRRFIRLYPIYWLYTLVFAAVLMFVGGTDAQIPANLADWLTTLSLIRFTGVTPPLPVAWTLFHELAFYAVFSILILNRRLGLLAFGLFAAVALALNHYPPEDARTAFNVYTAAYNLYFVFGMGAFWLYRRAKDGLALLLLGVLLFVAHMIMVPLPYNLSPLLLVLAFTLIVGGVTQLEASGRLAIPGLLAFVGDASYTIYLTHSNFEGTLLKLAVKAHLEQFIGPRPTFVAVLVGTVALGCLAYFLVERPLLRALHRRDRSATPVEAVRV